MKTLVFRRIRFICVLIAATVLWVELPARPAFADSISVTLGAAGPAYWTVLETGNGNVSVANASNAGSINGNIGVNGGNFSDSATPVNGNVNYGTAATINSNVAGNVKGTITKDQAALTAAVNSANIAASTFAVLAATLTAPGGGAINNTSATITLTSSGTNVIDLSSVNLSGANEVLTINGNGTGGDLIVNISGPIQLSGANDAIALTGGLTASQVVFNFTGTQGLSTSSGLMNEVTVAGIFLAPNAPVSLSPGALTGEIISGRNINIASGGSAASSVPDEPSTLGLLGCALLGLGVIRRLRKASCERVGGQ